MSVNASVLARAGLNARQQARRVNGARALTDLEMNLRRVDRTGRTRLGDLLAAPDDLATLYQELRIMRIGRHIAARMLDQHQIAVAAQLVPA